MNANPGINELHTNPRYQLIADPEHNQIKEFVIGRISRDYPIVRWYMVYQILMIAIGIFFLIYAIAGIFKGYSEHIFWAAGALLFGFTFLILLHELLHGLAFKIAGVKKVRYGAFLKKFIFYAEADRFVLNRKQFALVALAPLVVVKIFSVAGIILFLHRPESFFFIILMCLHSLFCAGDMVLLSFFYTEKGMVYTYDDHAEKKSYYFRDTKE